MFFHSTNQYLLWSTKSMPTLGSQAQNRDGALTSWAYCQVTDITRQWEKFQNGCWEGLPERDSSSRPRVSTVSQDSSLRMGLQVGEERQKSIPGRGNVSGEKDGNLVESRGAGGSKGSPRKRGWREVNRARSHRGSCAAT